LARLRGEAKAWEQWARQSEMQSHLLAMAKVARNDVAIRHDELDADQWSLNAQNGIIDLRDELLTPHDRKARATKIAGADLGMRDTCPTWIAFLTRIMGGDPEMVAFLQRVVGYCLTGSTREQCLFILYGSGSNGKSTFLDTLRAILGDYAIHARAETFVRDTRGGIPNDIAALRGARLVTASEPEQGEQLDEGLVKEMTGDAAMTARFMRSEFFTFQPTFKVLLATNHRPVIRGTDHGIWRRIRLVPFTETISDEEKDRDLGAKLAAEAPGILAWAVDGCTSWQRMGLAPPQAVADATQDYRADMDVLAEFIGEKCILANSVGNTALYQAFSAWAAANGERPRSHRWLSRALTDRGYKQDPNRATGRRWLGLSLREQPSPGSSRADRSVWF
jgi:putative DNA primase/helicase